LPNIESKINEKPTTTNSPTTPTTNTKSEQSSAIPKKEENKYVSKFQKASHSPDVWTEYQSKEGYTYYYNTLTQETTWDIPPNFVKKK